MLNGLHIDQLAALPPDQLQVFLDQIRRDGLEERIVHDWRFTARDSQLPPDWSADWQWFVLNAGRGFGKMLTVDTALPTPTGWTTMGAVQVGNFLLDEQGSPCRVTHKTPVQYAEINRVRFSDGSWLDACAEHQWATLTALHRKRLNRRRHEIPDDWAANAWVGTTASLRRTLRYGKRGDRNHAIPMAAPLSLPLADLPVDPYVLGYWLGDGTAREGSLTIHPTDQPSFFLAARRYKPRQLSHPNSVGTRGLTMHLRELGVLNNKHIPEAYLRAAESQRLALLRGLMDSDGYAAKSNVEFTTINSRLAAQVSELALSLGEKPRTYRGRATLYGEDKGPKYRICWRPAVSNPFHLARKAKRITFDDLQASRNRHRMVTAVEHTGVMAPMQCVSVDSPHRLYLAGRAMIPTHNTWCGSNLTNEVVYERGVRRVALVGPTLTHVRNVMIEGPSGLIAQARPGQRPTYHPGKFKMVWPNGAVGFAYTSENPKKLRGPEHEWAWCDEIAHWANPSATFSNLRFGLRLGERPRSVFTSTPRPIKLVRKLLADPQAVVRYGSTMENAVNLAAGYWDIIKEYEGTRLGRQEIEGKVLLDNPGALWQTDLIEAMQLEPDSGMVPHFAEIVVAIDPAMSHGPGSNETGIIVAARGVDGLGYVLDDRSVRGKPSHWAKAAVDAAATWGADVYVAERNNGGDLVAENIRAQEPGAAIRTVWASRGKVTRAQPIATLDERGQIKHIRNRRKRSGTNSELVLAKLEDQMLQFEPGGVTGVKEADDAEPLLIGDEDVSDSPDRVDARVWALTYLFRRELKTGNKFRVF